MVTHIPSLQSYIKEVKKVGPFRNKKELVPILMVVALVVITILLVNRTSDQSLTKSTLEILSPLLLAMFTKLLLARDEH